MLGILTEKPSAAANFAKALGGKKGVFLNEEFVILNAFGHMYEYVDPAEQVPFSYRDKYRSWNIGNLPWDESLFSWKRKLKEDSPRSKTGTMKQAVKELKLALSSCDEIVIATDVDPSGEGELLAWEILYELGLDKKKISRMYFMDESENEIRKAFSQRRYIPSMMSDMDYQKAVYRSKWDMLSMQFTRIASNYAGGGEVLRQGRLKSVMVKITGDGLKALDEYKPVPFYMNKFKDENGVVYTSKKEASYPNKNSVPQIYHPSDVVRDSTEIKRTSPPKLIDLAALSSRMAAKGIKAKTVLDVYQKMYEAQVVSYPRTEDKVVTPEQFKELLPLVDKIADVVGVDKKYLSHRTIRGTHVKTGGSHGANRPGTNVPGSLSELRKFGACAPMIYEILAKNYLAMLADDYEYEFQKGHIKDYPDFVGTASVPKKMGWKNVFNDEAEPPADENAVGIGTKANPFVAEGVNKKPPVPTMKWLMKQLEKNDVGTGSTRTSIYADVTNEKAKFPLLLETKGRLSMTQYGKKSYLLLKDTMIGDVRTTEKLMGEMRDICSGKMDPKVCLSNMKDIVMHDLDVMKKNAKENGMDYTETKEKYTGVWCGEEVSFTRVWSGHYFTDEECEALCEGKEVPIYGLISSKGNKYGVTGKLERQSYNGYEYVGYKRLGFVDDPEELMAVQNDPSIKELYATCPNCGGRIVKGRVGWECEKKCGVLVRYKIAERDISPAEAESLLNHGRTDILEGFYSKNKGVYFPAGLKIEGSEIKFYFPER